MPDPGARGVLLSGISPGRKGTSASRDGDVRVSGALARAGSVLPPLDEGGGRNGEGGMPEPG